MGLYKLSWKESVRADLRRIPPEIVAKIINKTESLSAEPQPVGSEKLKDTQHTYRLRVGDYRIIYQINVADEEIIVYRIRHRKDVYRN